MHPFLAITFWLIALALFGVMLWGAWHLVQKYRAGERERVNNLLLAELQVGLFLASLLVILVYEGKQFIVSQSLLIAALAVGAVSGFRRARRLEQHDSEDA